MTIGKKMEREREKRGLSRPELAKLMGKDTSTIYRWEKDQRSPSTQDAEDFAKALNITVGELMAEDGGVVYYKDWVKVPVLSNERQVCGVFERNPEDPDYNDLEVEFAVMVPYMIAGFEAEKAFAIRAQGDAMAPEVRDGSVCLINPSDTVYDGDMALVCVNGATMVKRVYYEMDGRIELRSENQLYPPKVFNKEVVDQGWVRVIGKVRAVISIPRRKA